MSIAIRKRPEEIKAIADRAKAECQPYISIMNEMFKYSTLSVMVLENGKISLKYSCEDNENFIQVKQIVENIYKEAEAEINK